MTSSPTGTINIGLLGERPKHQYLTSNDDRIIKHATRSPSAYSDDFPAFSPTGTSDLVSTFPLPPTSLSGFNPQSHPLASSSASGQGELPRSSSAHTFGHARKSSRRVTPPIPSSLDLQLPSVPPRSMSFGSGVVAPGRRKSQTMLDGEERSSFGTGAPVPYHPSNVLQPTATTSPTQSSDFKRPFLYPSPPTPPPKAPPPLAPSFTSIYFDPDSCPKQPSSPVTLPPRKSSYPSSNSHSSERLSPIAPRPRVPSFKQNFLGEWLKGKGAATSGKGKARVVSDLPLGVLAFRAGIVEKKLEHGYEGSVANSTTDDTGKGGRRPKRRNASLVSKWSFGGGYSQSDSGDRRGWERVERNEEEKRRIRREEKEIKRQREVEKEKRRTLDSRTKTQEWLAKANFEDNDSTMPPKEKPLPVPTVVSSREPKWKGRRLKSYLSLIAVLGIVLIVAVVVTLVLTRRHTDRASTVGSCSCSNGGIAQPLDGICACDCGSSGFGGTYCQLSTSCQYPGGSAYPIAEGLLNIATNSNTFFSPAINETRLALVVNTYLGVSPAISDCTAQLSLVSIPSLAPSKSPRRLAWSSAAVLWSAAMTEQNSSTLLYFIASHNFSQFGDVPSSSPDTNYQILHEGYIFDFAALEVSIPTTSYVTDSNAPISQTSSVSNSASQSLDRLYGFSIAASLQRGLALQHLWAELGLTSGDLPRFLSAIKAAPVVIPFNAEDVIDGRNIMSLALGQSKSASFPPAIGCLSGLSLAQVGAINSVEIGFDLQPVSKSQKFDEACLNRPLYGILNILGLRLPFLDSDPRIHLPKQALVLNDDTKSRVSLHAGELLVGACSGPPTSPSSSSLPDHFGTFTHIEVVILDFLNLIPASLAKELVAFILSQSTTPPLPSSALYQLSNQLLSLPLFEIQIWGGVRYTDIDHTLSSLASSNSTQLFFGSSHGNDLRQWAIAGSNTSQNGQAGGIDWSLSSLEGDIVVDKTLRNKSLLKVWNETLLSGAAGITQEQVWSSLTGN